MCIRDPVEAPTSTKRMYVNDDVQIILNVDYFGILHKYSVALSFSPATAYTRLMA